MDTKKNFAEFVIWWLKSGGPHNDRTVLIPVYGVISAVIILFSFSVGKILGWTVGVILVGFPAVLFLYVIYNYFADAYREFRSK